MRFILLPALALSSMAHAIVIRHDKPDSLYLTTRAKYPYVGRVSGLAEGTLISDRWVLTAAHVATGLSPFNAFVDLNGKRYGVKHVLLHPQGDVERDPNAVDLALLYLSEPVRGIRPAKLYTKQDEIGKIVTFVGSGLTGNGLKEPTIEDKKVRAARNTVEDANQRVIFFTFDAPPNGLDNEGISGPGDSGGPALVFDKGEAYILGVSSGNSNTPQQAHCTYGTKEYYARVSVFHEWITSTMKGAAAPNWGWSSPQKQVPDSPQGALVTAFVKAFNTGKREALAQFDQEYRTPTALQRRTPDQRWQIMKNLIDQHGTLTPVAYSVGQDGNIAILLRCGKTKREIALQFFLVGSNGATKLDGFTVAEL